MLTTGVRDPVARCRGPMYSSRVILPSIENNCDACLSGVAIRSSDKYARLSQSGRSKPRLLRTFSGIREGSVYVSEVPPLVLARCLSSQQHISCFAIRSFLLANTTLARGLFERH